MEQNILLMVETLEYKEPSFWATYTVVECLGVSFAYLGLNSTVYIILYIFIVVVNGPF